MPARSTGTKITGPPRSAQLIHPKRNGEANRHPQVSLYEVQHLLGRESFQITQRYAHLQPDARKAVLGAWEGLDVPLTIASWMILRPVPSWTGRRRSPDQGRCATFSWGGIQLPLLSNGQGWV